MRMMRRTTVSVRHGDTRAPADPHTAGFFPSRGGLDGESNSPPREVRDGGIPADDGAGTGRTRTANPRES